MTRTWLLTWSSYGTWLPGDERGFVSGVRNGAGHRDVHNTYDTPYDTHRPALRAYAQRIQRQESVWLTPNQAAAVAKQLHETAQIRGWHVHAMAVMANHVHLVVEANEEVLAAKMLTDFKAYTTRRLRRLAGRPTYRVWTERGSTRLLPDDQAREAAILYLQHQEKPLVVYVNDQPP